MKNIVGIFALAIMLSHVPTALGSGTRRKKITKFFSLLSPRLAVGDDGSPSCTASTGSGVAFLRYNSRSRKLCWFITYALDPQGDSIETVAHIHGPAAPGVAAGVQVTFGSDNPKRDCAKLSKEQEDYLFDSLLYINIHSELCPSGEIRGQIVEGAYY